MVFHSPLDKDNDNILNIFTCEKLKKDEFSFNLPCPCPCVRQKKGYHGLKRQDQTGADFMFLQ